MRRIEAVEGGVDVAGLRDAFENVGRLGGMRAVIDFHHDAVRRDAAGREMTGEGHDRLRQPDIGNGERVGAGRAGEVRRRIIRRIERVGAGIFQPGDRRCGVAGEAAVANPDRRELARGVIAFQRLAFGEIVDALVEFLNLIAQTVGDLAVIGGQCLFERGCARRAGIDRRGGLRRNRRLRQRLRFRGFARHRLLDVVGVLLGRRRVVAAQALAVQGWRRRCDLANGVRCGGRDPGRCDNQRQHGAGQKFIEPHVTHDFTLHTHSPTECTKIDAGSRGALLRAGKQACCAIMRWNAQAVQRISP